MTSRVARGSDLLSWSLTLPLLYALVFGVTFSDLGLLAAALTIQSRFMITEWLCEYCRNTSNETWIGSFVALGALLLIRAGIWRSSSDPTWNDPSRPLLFPCQTTHSRLHPKSHSFKYSYLVVGIPVGWEGVAGGMISAGVPNQQRRPWWFLGSAPQRGWYDIDAKDYLERGNLHLGLRGKLSAYLKSQVCDCWFQRPWA